MNHDKVIWQEGMLLRPQHLQHNDRYFDHQLKVRTRLLSGYTWGFLALEIDAQFLNMGRLVVNRASGVLPDGSLFELDGSAEPLVLEVPSNICNTPIYLALPLVTGNHIESRRPEQSDVLARYITYDAQVSDSNAADSSSSQISCGRLDFRLLLGEQQGDQVFVKLKLCEVLDTTPDGAITLDSDFVPTFIQVKSSAYLLSCLKEVIGMLGHRGESLAERIRSYGKSGGAQVGDFMMLQLINRTELLLRHQLELELAQPETLYRMLLALLGELATFSTDSKRPPLDNRYQHSNQGECFRSLMQSIRQVLSMVLEQHAIELQLQARQYGILVSQVNDLSLLDSASFVLAASADCDGEELRRRLPSHLKIGSVEQIRQLVNLHLPGIRIRPLPVVPRQIAFHANKAYFILEPSAEDLAQVKHSAGFAFHVSGEFSELELNFWAIRN
ncbi:type VI secretion system baseplate subunit TssK [Pseudomonas sp. Z4-7]|uniref:type VI secretion system baseplate subunit TssK n=1 Tax=Pseudomonas sp. Z4-7 TaxID=2817413 RepID=UPI003DA7EF55